MPDEPSLTSPVNLIGGDDARQPEQGIALCLSGGGYRAMLFHLGSLWRLNEAGLLPKLDRISSVSGGSIAAGVLGLAWPELGFNEQGIAAGFEEKVTRPIRRLRKKPSMLVQSLAESYCAAR
jgi:NTE family protein